MILACNIFSNGFMRIIKFLSVLVGGIRVVFFYFLVEISKYHNRARRGYLRVPEGFHKGG